MCLFSEVLLVLPTLGVQVKTQYWFGRQETQFFDKIHVKGIVINEAVTMVSIGVVVRRCSFLTRYMLKALLLTKLLLWLVLAWSSGHADF